MTIELVGIRIYPVKSLRGTSVTEAVVKGGRLVGDREWLLVDDDGRFMHQRDYPQMARLRPWRIPGGLAVEGPQGRRLELMIPAPGGDDARVQHVRLWRRRAPVRHVSDEADAWFSRELGVPARLVAWVPDVEALELPDYERDASLQDCTPFHLTSQDSLDDLNGRMAAPVPMDRFRPNLVVRGAAPYAEDAWREIEVGEIRLRWIKACTRCAITTTDHVTGERISKEPLRTLATYRRLGNQVAFGHYLVSDAREASLVVGAPVSIVARADD